MGNGLEQPSLKALEVSDLLFEKYNKMYEANPFSTVFAPLAECFRKIGRKDKALSILRDGIKHHPDYLLGYLGLAQCYFDLEQFTLAYNTLSPLIDKNRENFRLLRLFAKICEKTNHEIEALDAYKYLLFLNPKDSDAAFNVRKLEDPLLKKLEEKKIELKQQNQFLFSDSDESKWETVSFQKMEILDRLAYSSQKKGDFDKAAEFVELSLTINPKDIWARDRKKTLTSNDSSNKAPPNSTITSSKKVHYKLLNFLDKIKKRSHQMRSQL